MPAIAHSIPDRIRQRPAQPGQKRHPDGPGRARNGARHLVRDRLPQRRKAERPALALTAADHQRLAQSVADRAKALEVGLPRVVETIGLDRRRRRHQECPQPDALARVQDRHGLARADADPGRRVLRPKVIDPQLGKENTLTARALFDQQDRRLEVVGGAPFQHRRRNQMRARRGDGEAQDQSGQADQCRHPLLPRIARKPPPEPEQCRRDQAQRGETPPQRRLPR